MWSVLGSALLGESSLQAAIREVKEELNIDVWKKMLCLLENHADFMNLVQIFYRFGYSKSNVDIKDVKIQEEEVNDVMWASKRENFTII